MKKRAPAARFFVFTEFSQCSNKKLTKDQLPNNKESRKATAFLLRFRGTLSGGLALSRFVAALLQGLNCLAIPPGVGPFHSVSSFRAEEYFFSPLNIKCGNASCFVVQVILIKECEIASSNSNLSTRPTCFSIHVVFYQMQHHGKRFPH